MKATVKQKWASLTDDDLTHIEGSRDKLVGRVQERYGHNKEEAEREVDDWRHGISTKLLEFGNTGQFENTRKTACSPCGFLIPTLLIYLLL